MGAEKTAKSPMAYTPPPTVSVSESVLFWAFRYALPRQTYAVSDVVDALEKNWKSLTIHTRELIHKEVFEEFKSGRMSETDHPYWKRLLLLPVADDAPVFVGDNDHGDAVPTELPTGMEYEDLLLRNHMLLQSVPSMQLEIKRLRDRIDASKALLFDFDGYYDPETGAGDLQKLSELVDEVYAILEGGTYE